MQASMQASMHDERSVPCAIHQAKVCRADERTVVPADEGVAILRLELAIDVLLRLLHRNVHVPIKARQHTCDRRHLTLRRQAVW